MCLKLPEVSCKYGAPMGRRNILPQDRFAPIKLHLTRLRWFGHDYDSGGAYWGNSGDGAIYWATDGETHLFLRAASREVAKAEILEILPSARFYR